MAQSCNVRDFIVKLKEDSVLYEIDMVQTKNAALAELIKEQTHRDDFAVLS